MATILELNSGRQYPLVAVAEIDVADLTLNTETSIFELPANAVILGYSLQVLTAVDGTLPTADMGILGLAADCLIDGVAVTAVEAFGESLFGGAFGTTNGDGLDEATVMPSASDYVTLTLISADSTSGRLRAIVSYVVVGRDQENQG